MSSWLVIVENLVKELHDILMSILVDKPKIYSPQMERSIYLHKLLIFQKVPIR